MSLEGITEKLIKLLKDTNSKVVFAESCTAGLCSAFLGKQEGISNYLCGSMVTYRPQTKIQWLNINNQTIEKYSCESIEVADQMSRNILMSTTEANYAAAIVGDISEYIKDKNVYISIFQRDSNQELNKIAAHCDQLKEGTRKKRQQESVELVYSYLYHSIDTMII